MSTALLVIDAQRVYTNPESDLFCKNAGSTIDRINKLIAKFQAEGQPTIIIRHVHKADGSDLGRMFDFAGDAVEDFEFKEGTDAVALDKRLQQPANATEIVKNRYSAFAGTDLLKHLQKLRVRRVVICGFMTNFCCDTTARDAHDKDFFVDFVADATGTPGTDTIDQEQVRRIVGEFLAGGFARVLSTRKCLNMTYAD